MMLIVQLKLETRQLWGNNGKDETTATFFLQKSDARECQETLANLPISVIGNFPDSRSPNKIIQEWARQSN